MIPSHLFHGCQSECSNPGHLERDKCTDGQCGCKCHLTVNEINIFKSLCDLVFSEGGDGDICICPTVSDYEVLAKRFRSWYMFTYKTNLDIYRSDEAIVLACNQESFMFISPDTHDKVGPWGDLEKKLKCTQYVRIAI